MTTSGSLSGSKATLKAGMIPIVLPDEAYTISCCGVVQSYRSDGIGLKMNASSITINPNGTIDFVFQSQGVAAVIRGIFEAHLYYFQDFSDTPTE